jgi:hypothetical protein
MDERVKQIVTPVLEGVDRELGASYAAVLYGSAARRVSARHLGCQFAAGVRFAPPGDATHAEHGPRESAAQHQPPPLLLERRSGPARRTCPIEVSDMQLAHELLRGPIR